MESNSDMHVTKLKKEQNVQIFFFQLEMFSNFLLFRRWVGLRKQLSPLNVLRTSVLIFAQRGRKDSNRFLKALYKTVEHSY